MIKVGTAVPSGLRLILTSSLLQHRQIWSLGNEALGTQYSGDDNRKGKGKVHMHVTKVYGAVKVYLH